jgi:hypothetical protein
MLHHFNIALRTSHLYPSTYFVLRTHNGASAIEVQKFNSTKKVTNSQNTNDLELDPSNKPVPSDFIGKLHPTDAVALIKEVRRRYEEDGYI